MPPVTPQRLTGDLKDFFKLTVGDWRVIYELQDERKRLVVRTVGHRREIYRPKR